MAKDKQPKKLPKKGSGFISFNKPLNEVTSEDARKALVRKLKEHEAKNDKKS